MRCTSLLPLATDFLLITVLHIFFRTGCDAFVAVSPLVPLSVRVQQQQQQGVLQQRQFHPQQFTIGTNTNTNTISNRRRHNQSHYHRKAILVQKMSLTHNLVESLFCSTIGTSPTVPLVQAAGINIFLFTALSPKLFSMLTPSGLLHSCFLGISLFHTLGWKGWTLCVMYLALGQIVTKVRFQEKEKLGIAESRGGRRGPENVWGSALTGLVCAFCSVYKDSSGNGLFGISSNLYRLGYVASIATKLADTFASEIGKAYGKTTFLITTLERVKPGTEGAISLEGTVAAVVGGFLLSCYGYFVGLITTPQAIVISTISAFIACNIESLLGATVQEKKGFKWMTNEVINFINTLVGAAIAMKAATVFL